MLFIGADQRKRKSFDRKPDLHPLCPANCELEAGMGEQQRSINREVVVPSSSFSNKYTEDEKPTAVSNIEIDYTCIKIFM